MISSSRTIVITFIAPASKVLKLAPRKTKKSNLTKLGIPGGHLIHRKMAKSLRSKSVRKAKAIRRLNIYKPEEDVRTIRLALAQKGPFDQKHFPVKDDSFLTREVEMADSKVAKLTKLKHRQRGQLPNLYGLSRKEMRAK